MMRYFWLIFLSFFLVASVMFAYQNQDPVSLQFYLDWINIGFFFSERPVFIPIFIALAAGISFSTAYFFSYHARLRLKIQMQNSEILRLKKQILLERAKRQKKQSLPQTQAVDPH